MTRSNPVDLVLRAIVPRAVDSLDINEVVGQVDVDHIVSELDVDAIVGRIDLDALMARIDLNALLDRIDLDALLTKIDLDALMEKVDIEALIQRANIDAIVGNASRGMFARLIDAVRRQLAGLDAMVIAAVGRVFRHRPREAEAAVASGSLTGRVAGGVSRLAAWLIDLAVIAIVYSLSVSLGVFLVGLFSGKTIELTHHGLLWFAGYVGFAFVYYWAGLSITGRSVGKGLIGLRVVSLTGNPITPGRAAVRTLVYPISFILALGLLPIVFGRQRRALHDFAAGDKVLYDWGDRPAELPAPLTAWVKRRVASVESPADQADPADEL